MSQCMTKEAWLLRAAIARDQTRSWWTAVWETAPTRSVLTHREQAWMWWGSTGFQAEMAAKSFTIRIPANSRKHARVL